MNNSHIIHLAEHKLRDVHEKIASFQRIERTLTELIHVCREREGSIICPLMASLHEGSIKEERQLPRS